MKQVILSVVKGMIFLLMWTFSVCVLAQNITVRGTVTDASGEALIGATVQVQGTTPGRLPTLTVISIFQMFPPMPYWKFRISACRHK